MSGGGGPPKAPTTYRVPGQETASSAALSSLGGLQAMPNYGEQFANKALGAFDGNSLFGYDPSTTINYGNTISQMGGEYLPYAQQLMSMGFDNNNDVYGRAAHNLTEQIRAGQGARGIQSSPYGAGLEAQALGDFNLDWENNRLSRAANAFGAALPGYQLAGNQMGQGQQLAQSVPGLHTATLGGLSSIAGRAYDQPNMVFDAATRYMDRGNAADNTAVNAYSNQIQAWQAKQQQDAAMWQALGSLGGQAISAAANPASLFGTKLWG